MDHTITKDHLDGLTVAWADCTCGWSWTSPQHTANPIWWREEAIRVHRMATRGPGPVITPPGSPAAGDVSA